MLQLYLAETSQAPPLPCRLPTASLPQNFVSRLTSTEVAFAEHEGPLGIKCCFQGEEIYETGGRRFTVDNSTYLILNSGQRYASSIESKAPVESLCFWFRPGFAEQVITGLCTPADRLLMEPQLTSRQPVLFFERPYLHDTHVSPTMRCIRKAIAAQQVNPYWLEEQFHSLLEGMLQAHRNIYADMERLPAMRQSTRVELFRQLMYARDFLDSNLGRPVGLNEVSEIACLSVHHFLRQFKHLFHETPHQYHRRKRLERAQRLLTTTELPITNICYNLGFESLGSFSSLFHAQFDVTPTKYRARFGAEKRIRLMEEETLNAVSDGSPLSPEATV